MEESVTITKVHITPEDIDIMEHVNNLVYIKKLEEARVEWFDKYNIRIENLIDRGLGFSLRNINISFIAEAKLGDIFTIKTIPWKLGNTSFTLKQFIYNQHDELIAEAETVSVMIDFNKRKSAPVTDEVREAFKHAKYKK